MRSMEVKNSQNICQRNISLELLIVNPYYKTRVFIKTQHLQNSLGTSTVYNCKNNYQTTWKAKKTPSNIRIKHPYWSSYHAKVSQNGGITYHQHSFGPQNHEKWRFYTPNIWVITPKNEGCGFPLLSVFLPPNLNVDLLSFQNGAAGGKNLSSLTLDIPNPPVIPVWGSGVLKP